MGPDAQLPAYPPDHPAFAGHFPGNAIVPGVLLLDAAVHALCEDAPVRIDAAKFLDVVRPDDALTLDAAPGPRGGRRFTLRHGERAVASGTLVPAAPDATPA